MAAKFKRSEFLGHFLWSHCETKTYVLNISGSEKNNTCDKANSSRNVVKNVILDMNCVISSNLENCQSNPAEKKTKTLNKLSHADHQVFWTLQGNCTVTDSREFRKGDNRQEYPECEAI